MYIRGNGSHSHTSILLGSLPLAHNAQHSLVLLYMYITKYGCVFLKLGGSTYVAMDLIPILFWVLSRLPIMLSIHLLCIIIYIYIYIYTIVKP